MENENQNSGQGQHQINIQLPSLDNISNKRPLIPSFFALAIIFFFFTFCVFKCGGQKIGSATGMDFVTGSELTSKDLMTGHPKNGQEIPANMWAIFAFGASIIGFGAFMIKHKREAFWGTVAGAIGAGSLIVLQFSIKSGIDKKAQGGIDVDFQFPYWGAVLALAIASIISYLQMQNIPKVMISNSPPSTTKKPIEESDSESHSIYSSITPTIKNIASSFSNKQFLILPLKLQDVTNGQILPLNGLWLDGYYRATIGRRNLSGKEAAAHIKIPDEFSTVSGIHAEFFYKDGVITLINKSQTNPTVYNSRELGVNESVLINVGDIVKMGVIEFNVIQ